MLKQKEIKINKKKLYLRDMVILVENLEIEEEEEV